jgi:hypothetical protein
LLLRVSVCKYFYFSVAYVVVIADLEIADSVGCRIVIPCYLSFNQIEKINIKSIKNTACRFYFRHNTIFHDGHLLLFVFAALREFFLSADIVSDGLFYR